MSHEGIRFITAEEAEMRDDWYEQRESAPRSDGTCQV